MRELGIVGFGSFGQFIVPFLKPFFSISVYNRSDRSEDAKRLGVKYESLQTVAEKPIVIMCVPVQFMEESLNAVKTFIQPNALVVDVSSVKIKPLALMKAALPEHSNIVLTHPLFGPQSGKNGIEGLNMVLCPTTNNMLTRTIYRFLRYNLKLNVLERTPELHDQQMAYVQALTHFVGRAVNEMDIPDVEQKTQAYQYLLNIKRNLGQDSMDLFLTIENENPYAKEVRKSFIEELNKLNKRLEE